MVRLSPRSRERDYAVKEGNPGTGLSARFSRAYVIHCLPKVADSFLERRNSTDGPMSYYCPRRTEGSSNTLGTCYCLKVALVQNEQHRCASVTRFGRGGNPAAFRLALL